MHIYTEEQYKFLEDNVKGISSKKLTELFNNNFSLELTERQIQGAKKRRGITSGLCTQFTKGMETWNKDKKGYMGANKTSFKKGDMPHNYKPVGSERVNGDDYIDIKVADPNKWRGKHILTWEEHNGPVEKGQAIIFGDGNNRNFDINNLILVTRAQLLIMNNNKLIKNDADLTRTGVMIADIYKQIGDRKRG